MNCRFAGSIHRCALFRELDNQLGDRVRCWIAAIN
jgi:hypothetical protein